MPYLQQVLRAKLSAPPPPPRELCTHYFNFIAQGRHIVFAHRGEELTCDTDLIVAINGYRSSVCISIRMCMACLAA